MLKKILKLSACALLLISLMLGVIACSKRPSEKTFKEAQKDAVGELLSQVDSISSNIIGADQSDITRDLSVSFELSNELISMLASTADMDFSWLNDISVNLSQICNNDMISLALALKSKGADVISANGIADLESGDLYFAIPALTSAYLNLNLNDLMENTDSAAISAPALLLSGIDQLNIDTEMVINIVNRYYGMIIDAFENVEYNKKGNITIGDISQKCIVYTAQMSRRDVHDLTVKILEQAKTDKDIKAFVIDCANYSISQGIIDMTAEEAYAEVIKSIDEAIDAVQKAIKSEEKPDTPALIWTSYMTKKAEVLATSIEFVEDTNDSYTVFWGKLQDKKNISSEIWLIEENVKTFEINGDLVNDNGLLSGVYEFSAEGEKTVSIELESINKEKLDQGFINGTVIVYPESGIADELPDLGGLSLSSISLKLDINHSSDSFKVKASILNNNAPYLSIILENKAGTGTAINVPENTTTDVFSWFLGFDTTSFLDNITSSGIPTEVVEAIVNIFMSSSEPEVDDEYYIEYDLGYSDGYDKGYKDGFQDGLASLSFGKSYDSYTSGSTGYIDGYDNGYDHGYNDGYNDAYYYYDEPTEELPPEEQYCGVYDDYYEYELFFVDVDGDLEVDIIFDRDGDSAGTFEYDEDGDGDIDYYADGYYCDFDGDGSFDIVIYVYGNGVYDPGYDQAYDTNFDGIFDLYIDQY